MKVEIDTESEQFKREVAKIILEKSDILQNTIENILDTEAIQEILEKQIKEILQSQQIYQILVDAVKEYVENEYCVDCSSGVEDVINEKILEIIKEKLR